MNVSFVECSHAAVTGVTSSDAGSQGKLELTAFGAH